MKLMTFYMRLFFLHDLHANLQANMHVNLQVNL